jgi:hypothetical protein
MNENYFRIAFGRFIETLLKRNCNVYRRCRDDRLSLSLERPKDFEQLSEDRSVDEEVEGRYTSG